MSKMKIKD